MIFVFTDFGRKASYMGQMEAVLRRAAPTAATISLTADAPAMAPRPAAYLLAAELQIAAPGDVILAVIDPGVGTARAPLAIKADGVWLVGPDNGLLAVAARRAQAVRVFTIAWRPPRLSASFHGRDLFAPVAAALAQGDQRALEPATHDIEGADGPHDLDEVVLVDDYGNAITGRRAGTLAPDATATAGTACALKRGRTFADDASASGFWYANSNGLAEISIDRGAAAERFELHPGTPVAWSPLPAR